jgi:hypothetical protein
VRPPACTADASIGIEYPAGVQELRRCVLLGAGQQIISVPQQLLRVPAIAASLIAAAVCA